MSKLSSLKEARGRVPEIRGAWDRLPMAGRAVVALVGLAFLVYIPFLNILPFALIRTDLGDAGSDWASVLFTIAIYVIIAMGLNVVIGFAGLLDLGYVGFFAIGAYTVALFGSPNSPVVEMLQNRFDLADDWALAWAACIPLAVLFTVVSGVILGAPTLRLRGDYLAIVTMGFGEIVRIIATNAEWTGGAAGITNVPNPPPYGAESGDDFFNVLEIYRWYWLALAFLIVVIFFVRRLQHSRVGRAWLAIREDEDAAGLMGVPAFKFKLWAFAMGAAIGGISGALFASRQGFVSPQTFTLQLSFLFVAMVVIGGAGNLVGVAVGAILLTYLPERLRDIAWFESVGIDPVEWRNLVFGVALVVIMVMRPQGLIPSGRRARELKDRAVEAEEENVHG